MQEKKKRIHHLPEQRNKHDLSEHVRSGAGMWREQEVFIFTVCGPSLKHTTEQLIEKDKEKKNSAGQKSILHLLGVGCCAAGVWKETSSQEGVDGV